jgi:hypothetical protein
METATERRPQRVRTVVYLDPAIRRRLKIEGAESDRTGGDIVEEALLRHFSRLEHHVRREKPT